MRLWQLKLRVNNATKKTEYSGLHNDQIKSKDSQMKNYKNKQKT